MSVYLFTLGIFAASIEPATGSIESILQANSVELGMELDLNAGHALRQREALAKGFLFTPSLNAQIEAYRFERLGNASEFSVRATRGLNTHSFVDRIRQQGILWHRPLDLKPKPALAYDIPMANNALVNMYVEYFTGRGRWFFQRWLNRSARYIPMMKPILRAHGLPEDLVYLAMIESGFVSKAYSTAAASGFWQFIASTGRQYKLKQTTWVDERRDFVRATNAAARYLAQLHKEFGDWHLAWAGYNAGGGRVRRALARHNVHSFWQLQGKGMLAKETQHYVPKILAAAIVAKNRAHYGFVDTEFETPLTFDTVQLDSAVALNRVAREARTTVKRLRELNPELLFDVTPPQRHYSLRVPKGMGSPLSNWLASVPKAKRTSFSQHRVKPGDTLGGIARRYGSTIRAVSEFNGIRNARALRIGKRLLIPTRGRASSRSRVAKAKSKKVAAKPTRKLARKKPTARVPSASKPVQQSKSKVRYASATKPRAKPIATHIVSTGDTFWGIAQRYRVSVSELKRWNGKRNNSLGIGEVLRIF